MIKIYSLKPEILQKICFALFAAFCFALPTAAQQPTPTPTPIPEDNEVYRVNSKLIIVPVSVTDANGEPVTGLTANDFRLEEENRPQKIEEVSNAEQVPLEIILLIDVSSSVNPLFEFEKSAAARFLREVMRAEDRASIFLVSDRPALIQARDTAEKTAAALQNVQKPTAQTQTAFFDTVLAAIDYLKKNAPQRTRRVILTLSDGEDTYSVNTLAAYERAYREMDKQINTLTQAKRLEIMNRYRLEAQDRNYSKVLRDLQNADTVFYSINPSGNLLKLNRASFRGQEGMQKFADETGGTAFLPAILPYNAKEPLQSAENARKNQENLTRIFRQISAELRAQYLLQFYSEADFPNGKYVRLKADLPNKTNLRVRARQGYFAN